mgnify:CR=1 FL=1
MRQERQFRVRRRRAGYSLLEILIVLSIIALIVAVVGPRMLAQLDRSKVTAARVQVRSLQTALDTLRLDIGRYPLEGEGLRLLVEADASGVAGWSGPYLAESLPVDPWKHAYVYQPAADPQDPPRIYSLGSDGKEGGSGFAADITGRADGS